MISRSWLLAFNGCDHSVATVPSTIQSIFTQQSDLAVFADGQIGVGRHPVVFWG